ncbi:helix-turn-helix domain-containing protein [Domibacillus mangrovi]|uniref:HTH cro/C1-type domain-containing protein n=1 Tax=Domibacillus mangrovi TaxID=1714354 RepID=A0A1Q5NZT9_9BACI|nr:helix-turn-helix transcriptional regulator [Domibacillus mangrovi]OKL35372.1 hypothetical protein BLL40_15780 [Domibacillus mangrovi]
MENNLRVLMAVKNINITRLAEMTGISRNTITNIYHEKNTRMDLRTINTLCNFFNCTPNDLIVITKDQKAGAKL